MIARKSRLLHLGALLLAWALAQSFYSQGMASPCTNGKPSGLFEIDQFNPNRVRVRGGIGCATPNSPACGLNPNQSVTIPKPANWPADNPLICYDTFQFGTKGRGARASMLVVQPTGGTATGVAISDDNAFQKITYCTRNFPLVQLQNNWDDTNQCQVMTFDLQGTIRR